MVLQQCDPDPETGHPASHWTRNQRARNQKHSVAIILKGLLQGHTDTSQKPQPSKTVSWSKDHVFKPMSPWRGGGGGDGISHSTHKTTFLERGRHAKK